MSARLSAQVLAADTWGVSGPQFLGLYVVLGLTLAAVISLVTSAGRHPGNDAIPAEQLTPVQLGLLSAGGPLAVTVALAELRGRDLVDVTGAPSAPVDPYGHALLSKPAAGLDAVTRAVHDVIGVSGVGRHTPAALAKRPAVAAALDGERERLEAAGLLTSRPHRLAYAVAGLLTVAYLALGVVRLIAGSSNHKPIAFLVIVVAVAAVAVPVHIAKAGTPRLSRSGKVALRDLRRTHLHLSPSLHPSWSTYGRASVVTATALFGGAVMFTADPVFAETAHLRDTQTGGLGSTGGGNSGSGGGSGCGGGSSCGGGGCGGGGCGG